jgi:hypothetical protein
MAIEEVKNPEPRILRLHLQEAWKLCSNEEWRRLMCLSAKGGWCEILYPYIANASIVSRKREDRILALSLYELVRSSNTNPLV